MENIITAVGGNIYSYCMEYDNIIQDAIVGGSERVSIIKYKSNHEEAAKKDSVIESLIPDVVPECILGKSGHCISQPTVLKIQQIIQDTTTHVGSKDVGSKDVGSRNIGGKNILTKDVGDTQQNTQQNTRQIIADAKEKLGCDSEMCILDALKTKLGPSLVNAEITTNFVKIKGPTDNKLLSNINIDAVMKVFNQKFPEFFPYNFNMINYAKYSFVDGHIIASPDTLATVQFSDLWTQNYKCLGCVINTDVYQGEGKHWMALFADGRSGRWTVEFFNSSGNGPTPEWVNWQVKTKNQMEDVLNNVSDDVSNDAKNVLSSDANNDDANNVLSDNSVVNVNSNVNINNATDKKPHVDILNVCSIRHQQSMTECGLYSLFYIYARLHGVPPEYFMKNPIKDQLMFEFRQHLFPGERGIIDGKFSWTAYKDIVNIKWE